MRTIAQETFGSGNSSQQCILEDTFGLSRAVLVKVRAMDWPTKLNIDNPAWGNRDG